MQSMARVWIDGENRGVFVSLRAALARGYRPLEAPSARRDIGAMCVRLVDRTGDVAVAALTDEEWAEHIRRSALARAHAHDLCEDWHTVDGPAIRGVLAAHIIARGGTWCIK